MNTEQLVRISKDYFITLGVTGVKAAVITYLPFFAVHPWSWVLDKFLNWCFTKLANILELGGYFLYTDLRVTKQGKAYVEAKLKGYEVELNGTEDEKRKAEEEIIKAFRDFAKFTS